MALLCVAALLVPVGVAGLTGVTSQYGGPPRAPTMGTAVAGNESVTLTWAIPTDDGGSAITGYVVTPYIGGTAQAPVEFTSTATSQVLSGLTNGVTYTFRVAAVNASGPGPLSTASDPATPHARTATESFVVAAFQDFLGRPPSPEEVADALAALGGGTSAAQFLDGLANSTSWVAAIVNQLYLDTLGRGGDGPGLSYWSGLISGGTLTVAQVAASFYASAEYYAGVGGTNQAWIGDLYDKILHRSADLGGLIYWAGQTIATGRVTVAYAFFQSSESAHTRVQGLYHTLLGRDPDQAGWDYWASVIPSAGDITLAVILGASDEYAARAAVRYP